jgi:membrane protein implicated in regulation of membrane protease activity
MIAAHAALPWLVGGVLLLAIEALAPGAFMMWLGLAALGVGGLVWLVEPAFAWQVVAFALLAAIAVGIGLRLRRAGRPRVMNTAESGLVGRSARVLTFEGREGRVRLGDSDWPARLAAGTPPPRPGEALRVVGVDGTTLLVGPPSAAG